MPTLASSKPQAGLTSTQAPFIEEARSRGELYISQPYDLYSAENHETWRRLYARMAPHWAKYAPPQFLEGIRVLHLDPGGIPRLADINRSLQPLTGFQTKPVSGYVPAFLFFDCLRNRSFPTTITIRRADKLDYLPEPDIFHDVAGHVPMHTDPHFAEVLVRLGECAHTAAALAGSIPGEADRLRTLTNIVKALARFFWFTVEFGLMRAPGGLRVYGSGLLSSFGEIEHAIASPFVQRFPLQLEWVVNQSFEIDRYQPLLFIVESFAHLFGLVQQLEQWMTAGRLSNVAPGEPQINERDLQSFLDAALD
jgi:phenylalanine-4-hydroxylase